MPITKAELDELARQREALEKRRGLDQEKYKAVMETRGRAIEARLTLWKKVKAVLVHRF